MDNSTPRQFYSVERNAVPTVQNAGWTSVPIRTVHKTLPPSGFDPRTVNPVVSQYTNYDTPTHFNPLNMKCRLLYLKTQFVPRKPLLLKTQFVPRGLLYLNTQFVRRRPLYLKTQFVPRRPLYLKTQFVPRCKYFSSRL